MSIPGFDPGAGGGGPKTTEEIIAEQMGLGPGLTSHAPGDPVPSGELPQTVGPPPPAYDPWADETANAPVYEPYVPPAPTGVDFFGLDNTTPETFTGNLPDHNYVSDGDFFMLPELDEQAWGIDPGIVPHSGDTRSPFFQPFQEPIDAPFQAAKYEYDFATGVLNPMTDRLIEIAGEAGDGTTGLLAEAAARGDWDEYNRLVTVYNELIPQYEWWADETTRRGNVLNQAFGDLQALLDPRGEGIGTNFAFQAPEQLFGPLFGGGEGPMDVIGSEANDAIVRRNLEISRQRQAQRLAGQQAWDERLFQMGFGDRDRMLFQEMNLTPSQQQAFAMRHEPLLTEREELYKRGFLYRGQEEGPGFYGDPTQNDWVWSGLDKATGLLASQPLSPIHAATYELVKPFVPGRFMPEDNPYTAGAVAKLGLASLGAIWTDVAPGSMEIGVKPALQDSWNTFVFISELPWKAISYGHAIDQIYSEGALTEAARFIIETKTGANIDRLPYAKTAVELGKTTTELGSERPTTIRAISLTPNREGAIVPVEGYNFSGAITTAGNAYAEQDTFTRLVGESIWDGTGLGIVGPGILTPIRIGATATRVKTAEKAMHTLLNVRNATGGRFLTDEMIQSFIGGLPGGPSWRDYWRLRAIRNGAITDLKNNPATLKLFDTPEGSNAAQLYATRVAVEAYPRMNLGLDLQGVPEQAWRDLMAQAETLGFKPATLPAELPDSPALKVLIQDAADDATVLDDLPNAPLVAAHTDGASVAERMLDDVTPAPRPDDTVDLVPLPESEVPELLRPLPTWDPRIQVVPRSPVVTSWVDQLYDQSAASLREWTVFTSRSNYTTEYEQTLGVFEELRELALRAHLDPNLTVNEQLIVDFLAPKKVSQLSTKLRQQAELIEATQIALAQYTPGLAMARRTRDSGPTMLKVAGDYARRAKEAEDALASYRSAYATLQDELDQVRNQLAQQLRAGPGPGGPGAPTPATPLDLGLGKLRLGDDVTADLVRQVVEKSKLYNRNLFAHAAQYAENGVITRAALSRTIMEVREAPGTVTRRQQQLFRRLGIPPTRTSDMPDTQLTMDDVRRMSVSEAQLRLNHLMHGTELPVAVANEEILTVDEVLRTFLKDANVPETTVKGGPVSRRQLIELERAGRQQGRDLLRAFIEKGELTSQSANAHIREFPSAAQEATLRSHLATGRISMSDYRSVFGVSFNERNALMRQFELRNPDRRQAALNKLLLRRFDFAEVSYDEAQGYIGRLLRDLLPRIKATFDPSMDDWIAFDANQPVRRTLKGGEQVAEPQLTPAQFLIWAARAANQLEGVAPVAASALKGFTANPWTGSGQVVQAFFETQLYTFIDDMTKAGLNDVYAVYDSLWHEYSRAARRSGVADPSPLASSEAASRARSQARRRQRSPYGGSDFEAAKTTYLELYARYLAGEGTKAPVRSAYESLVHWWGDQLPKGAALPKPPANRPATKTAKTRTGAQAKDTVEKVTGQSVGKGKRGKENAQAAARTIEDAPIPGRTEADHAVDLGPGLVERDSLVPLSAEFLDKLRKAHLDPKKGVDMGWKQLMDNLSRGRLRVWTIDGDDIVSHDPFVLGGAGIRVVQKLLNDGFHIAKADMPEAHVFFRIREAQAQQVADLLRFSNGEARPVRYAESVVSPLGANHPLRQVFQAEARRSGQKLGWQEWEVALAAWADEWMAFRSGNPDEYALRRHTVYSADPGPPVSASNYPKGVIPEGMTPTAAADYLAPLTNLRSGLVRFFDVKDGNEPLDSLLGALHEYAHHLRVFLPDDQLKLLEQHYGIVDGNWEIAHEEAFVADLETYWRHYATRPGGPLAREQKLAKVAGDSDTVATLDRYFEVIHTRIRDVYLHIRELLLPTKLGRMKVQFFDDFFDVKVGSSPAYIRPAREARTKPTPQAMPGILRHFRQPIPRAVSFDLHDWATADWAAIGKAFDDRISAMYDYDDVLQSWSTFRKLPGVGVMTKGGWLVKKATRWDLLGQAAHVAKTGDVFVTILRKEVAESFADPGGDPYRVLWTRLNEFKSLAPAELLQRYPQLAESREAQAAFKTFMRHHENLLSAAERFMPHESLYHLLPAGILNREAFNLSAENVEVIDRLLMQDGFPKGMTLTDDEKVNIKRLRELYRESWRSNRATFITNDWVVRADKLPAPSNSALMGRGKTLLDSVTKREGGALVLDPAAADKALRGWRDWVGEVRAKGLDVYEHQASGPPIQHDLTDLETMGISELIALKDEGGTLLAIDPATEFEQFFKPVFRDDIDPRWIDEGAGIKVMDQWTDPERYIENIASELSLLEAHAIGYDPSKMPLLMRVQIAIKNALVPLWMTFMPSYHINNLAGNYTAQLMGAMRSDIHGITPGLRLPERYKRASSRFASGVGTNNYVYEIGRYSTDEAGKRIRREGGARVLNPLWENRAYRGGLTQKAVTDQRGQIRRYTAADTLPPGKKIGDLVTEDLAVPFNPWSKLRDWRGGQLPGEGLAESIEQGFRELIYGKSFDWTYGKEWEAAVREMNLGEPVAAQLRELIGLDEVSQVTRQLQNDGLLDSAEAGVIMAAQRRALGLADQSGYHAARTILRDYRMRNRFDGVLDLFFPVHFWATKNMAFVAQTAVDRPAAALAAMKLYDIWQEERDQMPPWLRAGYVTLPDELPFIGGRELRVTNLLNPAIFAVPKIVNDRRWSWGEGANLWENLGDLAKGGVQALYAGANYRIGPQIEGILMGPQILRNQLQTIDPETGERVMGGSTLEKWADRIGRVADFLSMPHGYKQDLLPFETQLRSWDAAEEKLAVLYELRIGSEYTPAEWMRLFDEGLLAIQEGDLTPPEGVDAGQFYADVTLYLRTGSLARTVDPEQAKADPAYAARVSGDLAYLQAVADAAETIEERYLDRQALQSTYARFGFSGAEYTDDMRKVYELEQELTRKRDEGTLLAQGDAALAKLRQGGADYDLDGIRRAYSIYLATLQVRGGVDAAGVQAALDAFDNGDYHDEQYRTFARIAEMQSKKLGYSEDGQVLAKAGKLLEHYDAIVNSLSSQHALDWALGPMDHNGNRTGGAMPGILMVWASHDNATELLKSAYTGQRIEINQSHYRAAEVERLRRNKQINLPDAEGLTWAMRFQEAADIEAEYERQVERANGHPELLRQALATRARSRDRLADKYQNLPEIEFGPTAFPFWPKRLGGPEKLTEIVDGKVQRVTQRQFGSRPGLGLTDGTGEVVELAELRAQPRDIALHQQEWLLDRTLERLGLELYIEQNGKFVINPQFRVLVDRRGEGGGGQVEPEVDWAKWQQAVKDAYPAVQRIYGEEVNVLREEAWRDGRTYQLIDQADLLTITAAQWEQHAGLMQAEVKLHEDAAWTAVREWYATYPDFESRSTPEAAVAREAINREYGPRYFFQWENAEFRPGEREDGTLGLDHYRYDAGARAVEDLYYTLTPNQKDQFKELYPDAFVEEVYPPGHENEGEQHTVLDGYRMTGAQIEEVLDKYGIQFRGPAEQARQGVQPGYHLTDAQATNARLDEAQIVEEHLDLLDVANLTPGEQERLAQYQDYIDDPRHDAASLLLETTRRTDEETGESYTSWKAVGRILATQDQSDPNVQAMVQYVDGLLTLKEEIGLDEINDKRAQWFAELPAETQALLLREAPKAFTWLSEYEGGSSGATGDSSTGGTGDGRSTDRAPRESRPRSSTSRFGASAGRSSVDSAIGSAPILPALVALDPLLQTPDGADYTERLGYAQRVGDWLTRTAFPLIQMAPGGKWQQWMQMLNLAMRAMVMRRLGPNPSLEAWRLLADELDGGPLDLGRLAGPSQPVGSPVTTPTIPPAPVGASAQGIGYGLG